MWAVAHFLELIWELMRYIYEALGINKYKIRQKEFNRMFLEE
ncbi:MAG: hypothetical protein OEY49_18065 [Candidatus Heimdallarchaeota archaeon]|nr:hypothetical protein [Candidatus Heimdallarchaeota archaeon]